MDPLKCNKARERRVVLSVKYLALSKYYILPIIVKTLQKKKTGTSFDCDIGYFVIMICQGVFLVSILSAQHKHTN